MLRGWRLAAPRYASSVDEMMSGEGAYHNGGRWNSKGVKVVYLGSSLAQAAMELLVHLGRADILRYFHVLEVDFPESIVQHIDSSELPDNWAEPAMAASVQQVGDDWVSNESSVVLQVPSAAVMGEYNYLVNPQHPGIKKLVYSEIIPFNYDPRLIK